MWRVLEGQHLNMSPSMPVTAEIHLGKRTVLEYLLSPVKRGSQETAREQ